MSFFLYPGQGSQSPGMGRDFYEQSPAARTVLEEAAAQAGDGFLRVVFEGPAEALAHTRVQQPALLAVEAAITRHLESRGIRPEGCAGHSLGEFSALVAAGALPFDAAFRLVQIRARLMAEEAPEGAMAAVLGLDPEAIAAALPAGVEIANFNGPQQTIVSGTKTAVEEAQAALKAAGARRVLPLPVSGPFHSSLMRPAAEKFREALADAPLSAPRCRFVSSVTGQEASDPEEIRELLARQICAPVRWTDVMRTVGAVPALEVGPGNVLQGLAKRMDGGPQVTSAGTVEACGGCG